MRKPITIAMLISVVMHAGLFVLLDQLLGDRVEPSMSDDLPEISIASLRRESAGSGEQAFDDRDPLKASDRQETVAATNRDAALPRSKSAASPRNIRPSSGLAYASARIADVSAVRDAAVSRPDVVVSTVGNARFVVPGNSRQEPPVFATAAMSRKQETMLGRKFKDWTENFHRISDTPDGLTWKYRGQEYVARFTQEAANDDMGIERVSVLVSTEQNGQRLTTEMRMKRLAFSNYAQFVNRWDSEVQIHDDELDGRFHSNTQISLTYGRKIRPQFHGQVTTSARRINFADRRGYISRDQIFLGGLQTGVKTIRLPKQYLPFPGEGDATGENVYRFDQDTRITFYDDGSFDWQIVGSDSPLQTVSIPGDTCYLVANEGVGLHVKGTVNGKVLVYSPERIIIEGDLRYAADPQTTPGADDYLGLASEKYVDIAPPDVTGPGDLVINAAIYAKRRFAVRRYRSRGTSLLHIYGSLTAGTLSATEPRYATKIEFDQRLETLRPPRFPMTDRYAVESWDNSWRIEPAVISH